MTGGFEPEILPKAMILSGDAKKDFTFLAKLHNIMPTNSGQIVLNCVNNAIANLEITAKIRIT